MDFKLGELFCGPGGLGLAALQTKIKKSNETYSLTHVWANDYDKDSCDTFRKNICPDKPKSVICKDVRLLNIKKLGKIDALSFGFPCNDFSAVGKKKGTDGNYGSLYSYGVKALDIFKPKWFLAENVGGLQSSNSGKAFNQIIKELVSTEYNLTVHLYPMEKYGVPQARRRIVIIGIRNDLGLTFQVPAPTTPIPITCKEALYNPPIPKNATNSELTKQSTQVIERLKHIKPGENAFNSNLPDHLRLNVKGARMSHIYKRLDPKKPAYTLTGSGGGGTHVYHWSENRALTNRERARLQTFPDNFHFMGSKESVRKQIGMVVPVVGAKEIFKAVLKTFANVRYASIPPSLGFHSKNNHIKTGLSQQHNLLENVSYQ